MTMMETVRISVRKLVEFLLKSGSIDSRGMGAERAQLGTKVHQELQNSAGENYQKEVPLQIEYVYQDILFKVDGRADGIIAESTIDEIKSTYTPFGEIAEDGQEVHWAQLICYGYFYAKQEEKATLTLQLTYYHLDEKQVTRFERTMSFAEMEAFFQDLIAEYAVWTKLRLDFEAKRNASLQKLQFPFEKYRKGQRELSIAVYRTISNQDKLFCEAPTGIGKTMSTIFPTLKAMGEKKVDKIFYLTAKTITRQVAEDAVEGLRRQDINLRTVTITAKDKICFLDERRCEPAFCQYANGYYSRVNDAMMNLVRNEQTISREIIEKYGRKHVVCPFELSLDIAIFCDMIICDYNYLFDPTVYLRRFFLENKGNYAFLIDEAHNLVERAKTMYSAELSKQLILNVKKSLSKSDKAIYTAVNELNRDLIQFRKLCDEKTRIFIQKEPATEFNQHVSDFVDATKEWLPMNAAANNYDEVLELFFEATHYLKMTEFYAENYNTLIETSRDTRIKQICIDPAEILRGKMDLGVASILFSGTLNPLGYYSDVLGGEEDTTKLTFPSPFSPQKLKIISPTFVRTRYHVRASSYERIVDCIAALRKAKAGNYMMFFPSYAYMEAVYEAFIARFPDVAVIKQATNMAEMERETFLAEFQEQREMLGFAILGGIFSEGVDLKGARLIGVGVVGVGLAQPSEEQNLVRDYYQMKLNQGFYYAYQIPGLNKVLQAAGRVIRSEGDKGVVLLLDDRFQEARYRKEFPAHWQHICFATNQNQLENELTHFWKKQEENHD